jgi:ectoine hydroxylase-related dioxygenase (phytanoyl-CoA dioxygenase family)
MTYYTTKENLRETIDRFGVAIIPNVLTETECENMVNDMWGYFEHITKEWEIPIDRNNKNTWREYYKLIPSHSMLIQHYNVGHCKASWDVRQNEKIIDIFSHFWGTDELLVSFDGLSFHFPPEVTNRGWYRKNNMHCDQCFLRNDFECIQSWVTGLDVNENDATLAFYEKSNNFHQEFKEKKIKDLDVGAKIEKCPYPEINKKDWYKLSETDIAFYVEKGCQFKRISCPKGSLVFWDSRTIHCGVEAVKEREIQNFRAVIYLCYMPKELCSEKELKKKQKAFTELRTTSHYPCKIKLFGKSPHTYGSPVPIVSQISPPVLTEVGLSLAGFTG